MTSGQSSFTPDKDGVYRWHYDLNLFTNPTIYLLVWKIFFWIITAGFAVAMISDAIRWSDFFFNRLLTDLKYYGIALAGMTVVTLLGYLLYAGAMHGVYSVVFEMDEKGIIHKQVDSQAKKAKRISRAAIGAGLATGRMGTVGAGLAASRTEMSSEFSKVRKVIACLRRNLIKVNGRFEHNQIYVPKEYFSFVLDYINAHCFGADK